MKGVYIVVIISVVWSIISQIIEKKKAQAAKSKSSPKRPPVVETGWKADPVQVKIESLRRRSVQAAPASIPTPTVARSLAPIKSLHVKECELQPLSARVKKRIPPAVQLARMLKDNRNLRTAIVLNEILSKPKAHQ